MLPIAMALDARVLPKAAARAFTAAVIFQAAVLTVVHPAWILAVMADQVTVAAIAAAAAIVAAVAVAAGVVIKLPFMRKYACHNAYCDDAYLLGSWSAHCRHDHRKDSRHFLALL
jgi:hypothetical protein